MLKAILLASSLLWLSSNLTAQENGPTQIKRAYLKGDFIELLKIYNTYPEYKVQIEDALLLSIEEKELSYEECLAGMKYCKSNRELSNFFNKLSQEKTLEITKKNFRNDYGRN
ncbi:hypothetical protein [Porphyromonas gulae]|uniref:Uncharacterized protein n=1 Tax=Porphyromonas gulae TaxID=111105 RepID=A0A0A2FCX1_9PORP|nr:hypothetical protein [Porphyromonas gulae]KGN86274.1 hypothetical protein HR08_04190 [Porphyromonas gulae]